MGMATSGTEADSKKGALTMNIHVDILKALETLPYFDLKEIKEKVEVLLASNTILDSAEKEMLKFDFRNVRDGAYNNQTSYGCYYRAKIPVIKLLRARTGLGLKESKEIVEAYYKRLEDGKEPSW